ncbi:uncharacterized protein LOC133442462 [Cololabis saira]|uniref:uncharacterized protein LOC133442462 n=1 Tax=Cololabis saira TaxID=129043 RepID=UPI002AD22751|nr:uncharacterized protein LOC133442462 [Cololabis saira]
MTTMKRLLLLLGLLQKGVSCAKESLFVYSHRGGDALLPCPAAPPGCSSITWSFFKGGEVQYSREVEAGAVRPESDRFGRMFLTSDCSLRMRGLQLDDAGSYACERLQERVADVYLSLLDISSDSGVAELRPGGSLVLCCLLFTYYDPGTCASSVARGFQLRWLAEDGAPLRNDNRFTLMEDNYCNVTLVVKLQAEDDNRRWRCEVNAVAADGGTASLDFRSSFLLLNTPAAAQDPDPDVSSSRPCPVQLPVSRIVLCVALPLMVAIVAVVTWTRDHKRAKTSAAASFRK